MNRNVLSRRVLAGTALAALALTGCSSNDGSSGNNASGKLSGAVTADGSSTVAPLSEAAATLYKEAQPQVNVAVGTSGTGGGFEKFCKGETDISNASRSIKDSETAACEAAGIKYVELVVANDALTVVVNKDNSFIDCLTTDQLKKIWEPNSTIKKWDEVDPNWPAEQIALFGPGTDSGTFDYFTDEINGEEGANRADYTASENDNVLVQGVSGSKYGLGYFGYTYYEENADKLKAVKIDAGSGCVDPSQDNVLNGTYKPLSRNLFLYVSDAGIKKPQVADFVDFYIENIDEIVEAAAYIPLGDEQKAQLTSAFESLKSS
ncbi:MAG TPA: PstS family phosphate ABC transporter substrate-binding protein [Micromonospora sp.]|nr:PstS family phosphate ABC transporter substrate-binding protein [Micromonospora sp.]